MKWSRKKATDVKKKKKKKKQPYKIKLNIEREIYMYQGGRTQAAALLD